MTLRALMPDDAGAARAFVARQLGGTRYEARTLEQLDAALSFEDPEYMAVLAFASATARVRGLMLFGTVAGASGVVKLHIMLGEDAPVREALAAAIRDVAEDSGERLIVAELADDEPFRDAMLALEQGGFVEEGRVADFVSDGVALRLYVWRAVTS
jgi:hypothetical protein